MAVQKKGEVVLKFTRNGSAGMCWVKLTPPQPSQTPTYQSANTVMVDRTRTELKQWYHATLFSPVKQTLIQATKKLSFATWPNLTIDLINKHLPQYMATDKGHMHQTRKPDHLNIELAKYTVANDIIKNPTFSWCVK